jgi:hypothetical protein
MLYLFLGLFLPSVAFLFFIFSWARNSRSGDTGSDKTARDAKRVVRHSTENESKRQRTTDDDIIASSSQKNASSVSNMTSSVQNMTYPSEEIGSSVECQNLSAPTCCRPSPNVEISQKVESPAMPLKNNEANQPDLIDLSLSKNSVNTSNPECESLAVKLPAAGLGKIHEVLSSPIAATPESGGRFFS